MVNGGAGSRVVTRAVCGPQSCSLPPDISIRALAWPLAVTWTLTQYCNQDTASHNAPAYSIDILGFLSDEYAPSERMPW